MPHLDKTDVVLSLTDSLHQAVGSIAGHSENGFNTPLNENIYKNI
jgi:hypothetical protein